MVQAYASALARSDRNPALAHADRVNGVQRSLGALRQAF